MRHALWIVAVVLGAACGRSGDSPERSAAGTNQIQSAVLSHALSRDTQSLQVTRTAKGEQLKLNGTFQSAAMARIGADGSIQTECFDEAPEAEAFLSGAPSNSHHAEVQ